LKGLVKKFRLAMQEHTALRRMFLGECSQEHAVSRRKFPGAHCSRENVPESTAPRRIFPGECSQELLF
jgi:hypothetical protein